MKKVFISLCLSLFLTVTFANGQTRGDKFQGKYGKPISQNESIEEFYVRENIILKVTYDDKNLPAEFLTFSADDLKEIEENLTNEIKEDLIPSKERIGKP